MISLTVVRQSCSITALEFLDACAAARADREQLDLGYTHQLADQIAAVVKIICKVCLIDRIDLIDRKIEFGRELLRVLQEIDLNLVDRTIHRKHENDSVALLDIGIGCIGIFLMYRADTRRIYKGQTFLQERGRAVQLHLRNTQMVVAVLLFIDI